jgi:predicted RNase H-like HicB family nuclease
LVMQQLIIVRSDGQDHFTAQAVSVPEVTAEGKTEAEALAQVKQSLATLFASAKVVSIDVPVNGQSNPWLDGFGRSANDPDFAAYQEELQRARAAEDAE